MSIAFTKTIHWKVGGEPFALTGGVRIAELQTPDGQSLTLSWEEWEALAEAMGEIAPSPRRERSRRAAPNHGAPWNGALDAEVATRWSKGEDLTGIAKALGRTRGGIAARLAFLGLVKNREEASQRRAPAERPAPSFEPKAVHAE